MKILRVKPVGTKDGETLFRIKVRTDSGERHTLLCKASDLSHPRRLNALAESRLGKPLVRGDLPPGELTRALSLALVPGAPRPPKPASFGVTWPAGHRDPSTGLPTTTGVHDQSRVFAALRQLLDRLQKLLSAGPGVDLLDEAENALEAAQLELSKIDADSDD